MINKEFWNIHYKNLRVASEQRVSFPTFEEAFNSNDNIVSFFKVCGNLCFEHIMIKHNGKICVMFRDVNDEAYDMIFEEIFNKENYVKACDFCIENINA